VSRVIGRHRRPASSPNPSVTKASTLFDSRVTRRDMLKGTGWIEVAKSLTFLGLFISYY
jgi:hypothetical protein